MGCRAHLVVFLLGVLWGRATAAAATFILYFGFPYTAFVQYVLFKQVALLKPYDNWRIEIPGLGDVSVCDGNRVAAD